MLNQSFFICAAGARTARPACAPSPASGDTRSVASDMFCCSASHSAVMPASLTPLLSAGAGGHTAGADNDATASANTTSYAQQPAKTRKRSEQETSARGRARTEQIERQEDGVVSEALRQARGALVRDRVGCAAETERGGMDGRSRPRQI